MGAVAVLVQETFADEVGRLDDPPGKVRMIWINPRIDHGQPNAGPVPTEIDHLRRVDDGQSSVGVGPDGKVAIDAQHFRVLLEVTNRFRRGVYVG